MNGLSLTYSQRTSLEAALYRVHRDLTKACDVASVAGEEVLVDALILLMTDARTLLELSLDERRPKPQPAQIRGQLALTDPEAASVPQVPSQGRRRVPKQASVKAASTPTAQPKRGTTRKGVDG